VVGLFEASDHRHMPSSIDVPADVHTFSTRNPWASLTFRWCALLPRERCWRERAALASGRLSISTQNAAIWHKLLSQGTEASTHGSLRLSTFHPGVLSAEELEYVLNDEGIPSFDFLRRILEPGSIIMTSHASLYDCHLKQYGPALVSTFNVFEDFWDEECTSPLARGIADGKFIAYHAMVLHAVITDTAGNQVYLLQNWYEELRERAPNGAAVPSMLASPSSLQVAEEAVGHGFGGLF